MNSFNARLTVTATLAALGIALLVSAPSAQSAAKTTSAVIKDASGKAIGVARFTEVADGTRITVRTLSGLTPGKHGVHIHGKSSCADAPDANGNTVKFGGAGAHFDPMNTNSHGGPLVSEKEGHAGDFPNLVVAANGHGSLEFTTKKLTVASGPLSVIGGAVVIHANEDNYTNTPALGGSGARLACGAIYSR